MEESNKTSSHVIAGPVSLEEKIGCTVDLALKYQERKFLILGTFDALSLQQRLARLLIRGRLPVRRFQLGTPTGWAALDPRDGSWRSMRAAGSPMEMIAEIEASGPEPSLFVLFGVEGCIEEPGVRAAHWRLQCSNRPVPHVVVLVDEPGVVDRIPAALRSAWDYQEDRLPGLDELAALIVEVTRRNAKEPGTRLLARALSGFSEAAARSAIQQAERAHGQDEPGLLRFLQVRKEEQLRRSLSMEILQPLQQEARGLDLLTRYIREHQPAICRDEDRLRGILLVGPPGTGKSLSARQIGVLTGHPVVDFRLGSLMGSYVGQTENNIRRATQALDVMAPVVVYMDEIEKALAGGASGQGSDGGVMARCHSTLLTWLNDSKAPIFVVGTANHLHRLEDWRTFARSGRFDDIFFVDVPGPGARVEILRDALAEESEGTISEAATLTAGFSGADLRQVARHARQRAEVTRRAIRDLLRDEIASRRSGVNAALRDFDGLRRWARENCLASCSEGPEV